MLKMADFQKTSRVSSEPKDLTGKCETRRVTLSRGCLVLLPSEDSEETGHNGFCHALGCRRTSTICMGLKFMGENRFDFEKASACC